MTVDDAQQDERKFATVLFADIVKSTSLVADFEPEQALESIRPTLQAAADAVVQFGGTVNRVTGDGIMAMFGAPKADEEHPLAACCAALEMLARVEREAGHLQLRIGLHSGEIVVHPLQVGPHIVVDAAGAAVHLAARLQQDATPGHAWISEATYRLAPARLQTEALGVRSFPGFPAPIRVHRLRAADPSLTRLDAVGRRELSPFTGREGERRSLHEAYAHLRIGRGKAIALIGDPGIGKTRLVREFAADLGATVPLIEARGIRWRVSSGFYPLRQLAQRALGLQRELVPGGLNRPLVSGADGATPHHADASAAVTALLGFEPGGAWRQLQPSERRQRMIEACFGLVARWLDGRPGVLVLDDLQWADADTEDAIGYLLDRIEEMPLLLLLASRQDHLIAPLRRPELERHLLAPLSGNESGSLARCMLDHAGPAGEAAVHHILERCGGNPLFIEEAARSPDPTQIPPNVRAVLAARVDRLEPGARRLVDLVAAMDEPMGMDALAACAVEVADRAGILALATALEQRGFLRLEGIGFSARISCRHALYQEVTYRALTERRRRQLHGDIFARLEAFAGTDAADHAEILARHARQGGLWEASLTHAQVAARRALGRFANRDAVTYIDQALHALQQLPTDAEAQALGIDLRFLLREPLFRLGRIEQLRERLDEAEQLALSLGDRQRLAQLRIFQSHHAWLIADYDSALRAVEQAEAQARDDADDALALRARFQRGLWAMGRGRLREGAAAMADVAACAADPRHGGRFGLDPPLVVVALGYQARMLVDLGALAEAREAATHCVTLAEQVARPFSWVFSALADGYVLHGEGQGEAAVARMSEGLALCDKAETDLMRVVALTLLGTAECGAGHWAAAATHLEAAVQMGQAMRFLWHQPFRLAMLARALTQLGRVEEALQRAEQARAVARAQGAEEVVGAIGP